MTAVSVDTDLSVTNGGTINDATSITGWSEPIGSGTVSGVTYADMKSIQTEPDVYIEGTGSISGAWTTNNPDRGGIIYNNNNTTVPIDGAIMIWIWWIAPLSLDPYSTAGIGGLIGDATNSLKVYRLSGNNFGPSPIGGWYCYPIDPTNTSAVYENVGSAPSTTINYIGGSLGGPGALSRGLTHFAVDAIRVGRCTSVVIGGTGADPVADFQDIVDGLEAIDSGAFGLFDLQNGSFFMQGLVQFGDNTSATGEVRFTDINKNINVRNTPAVGPNFNRIEIQNGSTVVSEINWTGCTFVNLGSNDPIATTQSRGDLVVVDSTANVNFIGCAFSDMGTFDLGSDTDATDTAWRRCETVTGVTGGIFTGCTWRETISDVALDLSSGSGSQLNNCFFVGDNTSHAINLGTISANSSIDWNSDFDTTTYATTNQEQNATSTSGDSEVILVNVASGQTLTINVLGGTAPTYRNTGSGTVVIQAAVTFKISKIQSGTEIRLFTDPALVELGGGVEDVSNTSSYGAGFSEVVGENPDGDGLYSVNYSYNYTADQDIFVVAHSLEYQYLRLSTTLTSVASGLQINQIIDRQYNNP